MKIPSPIRRNWEGFITLLFPPVCVHCARVGEFFCPFCRETEVYPIDDQTLPELPHLDGITAWARHRAAVRSAIHALKYEHTPQVAPFLVEGLAPKIEWTIDAIVPVPLHFTRLAERGYNQANVLAEALAMRMNLPVFSEALERTKATASQVTLNAEQRRENLLDAFVVNSKIPPRVLLIDDVCTTGSTLIAAASALRQAGVEAVYAATVSRP